MCLSLLVISDIHGSYRSLNRINATIYNQEPDGVIICGDITNFGDRDEAIDILKKIDTDTLLGVIGNCDPIEVQNSFDDIGGTNLDMSTHEIDGFIFAGLSGSNYSKERLSRFEKIAHRADIFVFHAPPYGFLDITSKGKHIGERGLLEIISNSSPRLILNGHVHESRGIIKDEGIVYVNPGPAYEDNLAIVKIGDTIRAKLL